MSEHYTLSTKDKVLLSSARKLLKKIAADAATEPAQLVTVAKLLHVLAALPRVTTGITASVSVRCPRQKFDDIETHHCYDFGVEEGQLLISSAGYFYRPSSGGDTFTTMTWCAVPGEPAESNDYSESLRLVPNLRSFAEGVERIDLAAGGYTIGILDDDNPLLEEENDDEAPANDESSDPIDPATPRTWSITPLGPAEERLAALVDPGQVDANEPSYAYDANNCDHCGCALDQRGLHIDGRLRGDLMWSNMCVECFGKLGEGIGWGNGQLYARQPDGDWRLVAGFQPAGRCSMDSTTTDSSSKAPARLTPQQAAEEGAKVFRANMARRIEKINRGEPVPDQ
jgi:hypothetical protein